MRDKIKVSQEFLNNPLIAEIFSSEVGKQLYLCIGSTHLRSQYFNDTILTLARHIEKMEKRPQTVQEMRSLLFIHGQADPAVCNAFSRPLTPIFYDKVAERSCCNWESYNRRIDEDIVKHQASIDKADAQIMELVDAVNGRNQWEYEIL